MFSCQARKPAPTFESPEDGAAAFVLDPDGNNIEAVRREFDS